MTCTCNARDCGPGSGHEAYCGRVETDSETRSVGDVIAADKAIVESRLQGRDYYAWFAGSARSRWPVYIAAIEAVTALHTIEKRYHDGSAEWSCDTPEEAADMGDIEVEDVEYFEICSHCGELEMCDGADEKHYMTAMWPCPTVRALAVLSTEETT